MLISQNLQIFPINFIINTKQLSTLSFALWLRLLLFFKLKNFELMTRFQFCTLPSCRLQSRKSLPYKFWQESKVYTKIYSCRLSISDVFVIRDFLSVFVFCLQFRFPPFDFVLSQFYLHPKHGLNFNLELFSCLNVILQIFTSNFSKDFKP